MCTAEPTNSLEHQFGQSLTNATSRVFLTVLPIQAGSLAFSMSDKVIFSLCGATIIIKIFIFREGAVTCVAKRIVLSVVLSGTVATFCGCGSAPVKEQSAITYTSAQVQQISDYSELLGAYQKSSAALQGKDPSIYASDFSVLKAMGDKLVTLRLASLQEAFNNARLSSGEVPQNVIAPARTEAENPPLPKSQWTSVSNLVNKEWDKTAAAVKTRVDQLEVGELSDV